MPLACAFARHPGELYADLMQYYGYDLTGCTDPDAAWALVRSLPPGSRFCTAEDPDCAWTLEAVLTASLVNSLRDLCWALAGDSTVERPAHVGPSWMREASRSVKAMVLPVRELDRRLAEFDSRFNDREGRDDV